MAVSSGKSRFFVFLVCAAAVGGGVWYARNGGWQMDDVDAVEDDEEPIEVKPDAGGQKKRPTKKGPPRPKKKVSEARAPRPASPSGPAGPADPPRIPIGGFSPAGPTGPSYESAIAGSNLQLAPGTADVPDLTNAELAGPMRDGSFLDTCGVPASTHVTVKVAIRTGRAVGISVYPAPPNRDIAGCVERHVKGLQWPSNAKTDSFITTY